MKTQTRPATTLRARCQTVPQTCAARSQELAAWEGHSGYRPPKEIGKDVRRPKGGGR
jgi:hypothetical protein